MPAGRAGLLPGRDLDLPAAPRADGPKLDFGRPGTRIKLVGLRRRVAEHMVRSKTTIPHYSYVDECEGTRIDFSRYPRDSKRCFPVVLNDGYDLNERRLFEQQAVVFREPPQEVDVSASFRRPSVRHRVGARVTDKTDKTGAVWSARRAPALEHRGGCRRELRRDLQPALEPERQVRGCGLGGSGAAPPRR